MQNFSDMLFPILFWAGVIVYAIYNSNKQKALAKPKTLVAGKKPQDFEGMDYESVTSALEPYESQETSSQEDFRRVRKSSERTDLPTQNQEAQATQRRQDDKKLSITASLKPIKSTKPPKPEKPKKGEEEPNAYNTTQDHTHPLKAMMNNPESLKNAFIFSEILKKRF